MLVSRIMRISLSFEVMNDLMIPLWHSNTVGNTIEVDLSNIQQDNLQIHLM